MIAGLFTGFVCSIFADGFCGGSGTRASLSAFSSWFASFGLGRMASVFRSGEVLSADDCPASGAGDGMVAAGAAAESFACDVVGSEPIPAVGAGAVCVGLLLCWIV